MKNLNDTPNSPDFKELLSKLETTLDEYLIKKAPPLPANAKEAVVKYAPYLSIFLIFILIVPILVTFGLGALLAPFAFLGGVGVGASFTFATLFLLAGLIIEIMAIPGLFKRQKSAWRLMYFGTLLNAVYNLLTFNLGNLIIGSLLGLYILFQIKSYYK